MNVLLQIRDKMRFLNQFLPESFFLKIYCFYLQKLRKEFNFFFKIFGETLSNFWHLGLNYNFFNVCSLICEAERNYTGVCRASYHFAPYYNMGAKSSTQMERFFYSMVANRFQVKRQYRQILTKSPLILGSISEKKNICQNFFWKKIPFLKMFIWNLANSR